MSAPRIEDRAMLPSMLASDDRTPLSICPELHGDDSARAAGPLRRTLRRR